jgi:hypothetical protein
MHGRHLITFTYNDLPRTGCPVILGYDAQGRESVFVYQTKGRTSGKNEKLPSWKCFKLDKIEELNVTEGRWLEGASHETTQTCIAKVDIDVNIPSTLRKKAPLPESSAKLLPPRQKTAA